MSTNHKEDDDNHDRKIINTGSTTLNDVAGTGTILPVAGTSTTTLTGGDDDDEDDLDEDKDDDFLTGNTGTTITGTAGTTTTTGGTTGTTATDTGTITITGSITGITTTDTGTTTTTGSTTGTTTMGTDTTTTTAGAAPLAGKNVLAGSASNDNLDGDDDDDTLIGGAGDDDLDGGTGNDVLIGGTGNDIITGGTGNDVITGGAGSDILDGGVGVDTASYTGKRSSYTISKDADGTFHVKNSSSVDTLHNVERLSFADGTLALDTNGSSGAVYRLYKAALDRAPDAPGLGHNIHLKDAGLTLGQMADAFVHSAEFTSKYGALSNEQFVTQLYQNVLHRTADAPGLAHNLNLLNTTLTRADMLTAYSESTENQVAVVGQIAEGIWLA